MSKNKSERREYTIEMRVGKVRLSEQFISDQWDDEDLQAVEAMDRIEVRYQKVQEIEGLTRLGMEVA